jgi:hypothetical protein
VHDQLFTADNFRRIFDTENRRGNDLATRFFSELEEFTLAVREKLQALRAASSNPNSLTDGDLTKQINSLKKEIRERKQAKSNRIDELMEGVSEAIACF